MRAALALAAFACFATEVTVASEVKVSSFGYDPEDSTRFIQAALDSGARRVVFDRQEGPWVTSPVFVRSDTEVVFEPKTVLQAKRGEFLGLRDFSVARQPACDWVVVSASQAPQCPFLSSRKCWLAQTR